MNSDWMSNGKRNIWKLLFPNLCRGFMLTFGTFSDDVPAETEIELQFNLEKFFTLSRVEL